GIARNVCRPGSPVSAMPARQSSRNRWVWYFVILAILTTGGITANLWYNLRQQLTPEELAAARRLWSENRPRDYQLNYTIKQELNPDPAGGTPRRFRVMVRDDNIASVTDPDGRALKPDAFEFDSMDALFNFIDWQLRVDAKPGKPRAFVKATFAPTDGHVTH